MTEPDRDAVQELLLDELLREEAPDRAIDLALAAFEGEDRLAALIGGAMPAPERPARETSGGPSQPGDVPGIYLRSISVRGFRGVGPARTLELQPGPGLTVAQGRNGSGKSSFAEAAELALTGRTDRTRRGPLWKDGWRSIHHAEAPEIQVCLTAEGSNHPYTVVRTWPSGEAAFDEATTTMRIVGQSPRPLAPAWEHALTQWRPFLAYSELSGLITDRNSAVFDRIDAILGLDDLTDTEKRLAKAHTELDRAFEQLRARRGELAAALEASGDPRARPVLAALGTRMWRSWNLDAAEAAATLVRRGTTDVRENAARRLLDIDVPSPADVAGRVRDLRAAAGQLSQLAGTPAAEARHLARLLTAGLEHHGRHGDGRCPLCRSGTLDAAWRAETDAEVTRLTRLAADADSADGAAARARRAAQALLTQPPAELRALSSTAGGMLTDAPTAGSSEEELAAAALAVWEAWAGLVALDPPAALADELERCHPRLLDAVGALRAAVHDRVDAADDAWEPLARQVLDWVDAARRGCSHQPTTKDLATATAKVKIVIDRLRERRLAPFRAEHEKIWAKLRQESNVDLGPIQLKGRGNARRVLLQVSVDGTESQALGVMSQGELHALGLTLFLPQATLPESPFRFVLIDDPVQAMDPSKVDGLAEVLLEKAKTHQVIVFTHDDRLADAVRRFSIQGTNAYCLEVTRLPGSIVEINPCLDPASKCLKDAGVFALTGTLPDDVKAGLVPGLCKSATDAAFADVYRRRSLAAGAAHRTVEDRLTRAQRTMARAGLVFPVRSGRDEDILNRVEREWGPRFRTLLRTVSRLGHEPYPGDYRYLVDDTRDLVKKIGELR
jgi:hypothetical protein